MNQIYGFEGEVKFKLTDIHGVGKVFIVHGGFFNEVKFKLRETFMELVRFSIVHGGFLNVGEVGLSDIKAIDLF